MPLLRRRRHPLIHWAVRSTLRGVLGVQRWCFAPVAGAVKGQVNGAEWLRIAAVALVPVFLEATAANSSTIFHDPWVATAVNGALLALASRAHRVHDGQ